MRIESLSTHNYRSLEKLELTFCNNYCTISGRNNAGKSSVIRLLTEAFRPSPLHRRNRGGVDFQEDRTQWIKNEEPIEIQYTLKLTRKEDPALITFIEKFAEQEIAADSARLKLRYSFDQSGSTSVHVMIDDVETNTAAAKEIDKRIKDSDLMFLYNSTTPQDTFFFGRGTRGRMFYDFVMSDEEKNALDEAGKHTQRKLKKFAKRHTEELSGVLGRLTERYDVEVAPLEWPTDRRMPLGINLNDRSVEVPLNDWGSGTQNRTHILMAILQANRIKTTESADERITPFVVVEEPESFLHPSAQAEFGRLLRELSSELDIQIITTTHSPYMLNNEEPSANTLLARKVHRNKAVATYSIDTAGDDWMCPFADHLGIGANEFSTLEPLFSTTKSHVLLVEGPIDKSYFDHLKSHNLKCSKLNPSIEVVPYGGKSTLKNTLLLQFVLRTFDKVFVTYDLDASNEASTALDRVQLKAGANHSPLGVAKPGRDCIEGILPKSILSKVNGAETDLVMQLGSIDNKERRSAKDQLKKLYLEEFKAGKNFSPEDLNEIDKAIKLINKAFQ